MLDARRLLPDRDARKPGHIRNISYPRPVAALDTNKYLPDPIETSYRPAPSPVYKDSLSPSTTSPLSATSATTSVSPASTLPRTRPTHGRKTSFSRVGVNVSSWLVRSSSGATANTSPSKSSKIVRISEPQLVDSLGSVATYVRQPGAGVQIVRTPQEALMGSGVNDDYVETDGAHNQGLTLVGPLLAVAEEEMYHDMEERETSESEYENQDDGEGYEDDESEAESEVERVATPGADGHHVPPAYSPPRSPRRATGSPTKHTRPLVVKVLSAPTRACPPVPPETIDERDLSGSTLAHVPTQVLPSLPSYLAHVPTQPSFDCIPLSDISTLGPHAILDPSRVLVTLDTSTATHRTTLATLTARPSNLSTYLLELFQPMPASSVGSSRDVDHEHDLMCDDSSFVSRGNEEDVDYDESLGFQDIFRTIKASSMIPDPAAFVAPVSSPVAGPARLHIFMDRPSEAYDHVLAFLRAPADDNAHRLPSTLSVANISTLIAVRDEAHYLDLQDLAELCTLELRARHPKLVSQPAPTHYRGPSADSIHTVRDVSAVRRSADSAGSGRTNSSNGSAGKRARARAPADVPVAAIQRNSAGSSRSAQQPTAGHSKF